MAYQRMGLLLFLLLFFIKNATSVCKISLSSDIISPHYYGPLIYKYKSDGTPVIHYPSADENCVFQSEDQKLHLACTGPDSTMKFSQKFGNKTKVDIATSNSVYLLHDPSSELRVRVHGGPSRFSVVPTNSITCSVVPFATMHLLNETKGPSAMGYVVGYRLNDIDLLKMHDQVFRDEEWIVTRYRINPVFQSRLAFNFTEGWMRGLFYVKKDINFTELYSKEYQIAEFQRHFGNVKLTEKYFSGNNSLVVGQLMFTEDTFYYNQILSTRYYESTAPIWKSVYEGNWRTIGRVIRKISDETARDLDVYVSAWPSYHDSWTDGLTLGNTSTSPDIVPVPQILIKAAVDVDNHDRGIVFHTFNDPHLDLEIAAKREKDYCSITVDCNWQHSEFEDVFKGYTFCCKPGHSYVFKDKFDL